ncbi:MAG: hypothetical protein KAW02_03810 [candidate division Zixibacteria bacterium]|nr:hypothetical protein [candidate division Zixibacteria bacterium]
MKHDIKDMKLAKQGRLRIEWAERNFCACPQDLEIGSPDPTGNCLFSARSGDLAGTRKI